MKSWASISICLALLGAMVVVAVAPQATGAVKGERLTVKVKGAGTVTGEGINCHPDCSELYDQGSSVSLTAHPDPGATFGGWDGDCSGSGSCELTMNGPKNVDATFDSPDTTPPETTITKQPKAVVHLRPGQKRARAKFRFTSSEDGSTFKCSLDEGKFKSCTSPKAYRVKKGKHTFAVAATDAAANTDASPATATWKVKK